jgi:hypothetical protein
MGARARGGDPWLPPLGGAPRALRARGTHGCSPACHPLRVCAPARLRHGAPAAAEGPPADPAPLPRAPPRSLPWHTRLWRCGRASSASSPSWTCWRVRATALGAVLGCCAALAARAPPSPALFSPRRSPLRTSRPRPPVYARPSPPAPPTSPQTRLRRARVRRPHAALRAAHHPGGGRPGGSCAGGLPPPLRRDAGGRRVRRQRLQAGPAPGRASAAGRPCSVCLERSPRPRPPDPPFAAEKALLFLKGCFTPLFCNPTKPIQAGQGQQLVHHRHGPQHGGQEHLHPAGERAAKGRRGRAD